MVALQCNLDFSTQAEQIIEEDNMLQSLDIIELYCKRLVEHATQLEKPE
jgi:vacuolar protein sorting-associated protein IST1